MVSNHTLGVAMRTTMKKEAAAKWSQSREYARKDLGKLRQLHCGVQSGTRGISFFTNICTRTVDGKGSFYLVTGCNDIMARVCLLKKMVSSS